VSCGLGVAFVSSGTRWRCPQGVVLLPVADLIFPLSFALIWKKDNVSPMLAKFVEDVRHAGSESTCQTLIRLLAVSFTTNRHPGYLG
jgi:DNA-binding transcriptional LysR family regulator